MLLAPGVQGVEEALVAARPAVAAAAGPSSSRGGTGCSRSRGRSRRGRRGRCRRRCSRAGCCPGAARPGRRRCRRRAGGCCSARARRPPPRRSRRGRSSRPGRDPPRRRSSRRAPARAAARGARRAGRGAAPRVRRSGRPRRQASTKRRAQPTATTRRTTWASRSSQPRVASQSTAGRLTQGEEADDEQDTDEAEPDPQGEPAHRAPAGDELGRARDEEGQQEQGDRASPVLAAGGDAARGGRGGRCGVRGCARAHRRLTLPWSPTIHAAPGAACEARRERPPRFRPVRCPTHPAVRGTLGGRPLPARGPGCPTTTPARSPGAPRPVRRTTTSTSSTPGAAAARPRRRRRAGPPGPAGPSGPPPRPTARSTTSTGARCRRAAPAAGVAPATRGRPANHVPRAPAARAAAGASRRALVLLLLAWVGFTVFAPWHAWSTVSRVDDAPPGDRPAAGRRAHLPPRRLRQPRGPERRRAATRSARAPRRAGAPTRSSSCTSPPGSGKPALISVPRDSYLPVPGHGKNKVNASFAIGGPQAAGPDPRAGDLAADRRLRRDRLRRLRERRRQPRRRRHLRPARHQGRQGPHRPDQGVPDPRRPDVAGVRARPLLRPQGDIGRAERQRQFLGAVMKEAATPSTVLVPWRWWSFTHSAASSVYVGEETGLVDAYRILSTMRKVSSDGALSLVVPLSDLNASTSAGSSVLWDEKRAEELFAMLSDGTALEPRRPARTASRRAELAARRAGPGALSGDVQTGPLDSIGPASRDRAPRSSRGRTGGRRRTPGGTGPPGARRRLPPSARGARPEAAPPSWRRRVGHRPRPRRPGRRRARRWATWQLNANITKVDVSDAIGTDRPTVAPEAKKAVNLLLVGSDNRIGERQRHLRQGRRRPGPALRHQPARPPLRRPDLGHRRVDPPRLDDPGARRSARRRRRRTSGS